MQYMNTDQKIKYYEDVTEIREKPQYMNKQQYLDFLIAKAEIQDALASKPNKKVAKKKAKK